MEIEIIICSLAVCPYFEKNWSIYSSPHPPQKKITCKLQIFSKFSVVYVVHANILYICMKNIYYCNWSIHNNAALTYQPLVSFHVE